MNKQIILILSVCFVCLAACKEDTIDTYSGANYVQFSTSYADSLTIAFLLAPGKNSIDSSLVITMSGLANQTAMSYKIVVNTQLSTAIEGVHFALPSATAFKQGAYMDTIPVTFYRTDDMRTKEYRLVLQLVSNENFMVGQENYLYKIFRINDKITQPAWWTTTGTLNVKDTYLGVYSDKKYEYFIAVTGVADLTNATASEMRMYALQFKYWLAAKKAADETVLEDNGNEMTVTVIG